MIRLSELRAPEVGLHWHEAVAVAAALASTLRMANAAQAATLAGAVVTHTGDVEITGEGWQPGTLTQGLATTLGQLIDRAPHPPELSALIAEYRRTGTGPDSFVAFVRALTFFERPDRRHIVRRLTTRAAAVERSVVDPAGDPELAYGAVTLAPPPAPDTPTPLASAPSMKLAILAATIFATVALGAATLFTMVQSPDFGSLAASGSGDGDERPAPSGDGEPLPSAGARNLNPPADARPRDRRSLAERGRPTSPRPDTPGDSGTPNDARPTEGSTAARASEPEVRVNVRELGGAALPADVAGAAPSEPTAGGTTELYGVGDAGVVPPTLVTPHLPGEPFSNVPAWQAGTLELTVGPTGAVEHVRLISPYNRYEERMLVAAAKAWVFRPATKDGRAVRCRTRIKVSL